MIPIRDHNPSGRTPIITWLLIAANVAVFGWMLFLGDQLDPFITRFALVPADIVNGENLRTLFTSLFLHGGFAHLIGNMLFLNIFGDNLEGRLGHLKYLGFYLLAGLAGSALQISIDPASTIPNIGASGAIAGLMGGYLVLFPHERIDVLWGLYGTSTVPASFMLVYWILFQFVSGFGSIGLEGGGVAYFAHIGGFAFGFLMIHTFKSRLDHSPRIRVVG